ncbi:lysophospholipase [Cyberlindnera jadinii NRRL Y-1542]|uniref:Lysophospholipase NTE1 n=1 Tax=Cyberlindnera jadinii (strain ATCC 18201 / CBS 1600 / BCRC 20928 / JCM 3617 / NBRC 0987 / NRRL Y-1542) TaxID=983966 RepID=A0A1E4S679_CYBJN|nr:patatin-domain-containing protein [Cyberlindnera jadinii NRRL Y-1542]ODV74892.1 patatin-domain-containing protein [Cyberlindnera jadinii NRRL Y-1542]
MDMDSLPIRLEGIKDDGVDSTVALSKTPHSAVDLFKGVWRLSWRLLHRVVLLVPNLLIKLLQTRFSFTLRLSSILITLGVCFVLALLFIRYRALTGYSKAVEEKREVNPVDTLIASHDKDEKRRFGSYLDEFLIAIKIFGYLEKPVFNELTRSMRTQKLERNEVFDLDDDLGFAIVVEGNVQIFTKVDKKDAPISNDEEFGGETLILNDHRYQLLNEVKTGNPLSSLLNILTLFTNDEAHSMGLNSPSFRHKSLDNSWIPATKVDDIAPLNLDNEAVLYDETPRIIARATSDSTVAIIPADAFKRLKRKHPRASSHIVQMILTRLYRVTFQTAHNYLGLTMELFETEKKLNSNSKLDLEPYLYEDIMKRTTEDKDTIERGRQDIQRPASRRSQNSSTSGRESSAHIKAPLLARTASQHVVLDSRDSFNPGDLLSNVPLSRRPLSYYQLKDTEANRSFSSHNETNDTKLYRSLVEGIFKFLGITEESLKPKKSFTGNSSTINSPSIADIGLFHSFSTRESTPISNGSNSTKTRTFSINSSNVNDDYSNEQVDYESAKNDFSEIIEIKRYDTGAILIQQNLKTTGIYYVVSGILDVSYKDEVTGKEHFIYDVKPGGVAGYMGSLIGYKSFVTVKARTPVVVGFCSDKDVERLCEKYFMIYLTVARSLVLSLTPKIARLDSALEWIQLDGGETLFKQGTSANGIYIILSGRFRSIKEDPFTKEITMMREYSKGESFGEVEVLTAAKRSSTFVAVRESEAARIPRTLFEILCLENPSIMIKVSRIVAHTVKEEAPQSGLNVPTNSKGNGLQKNYKTITILPKIQGIPVTEFASKLIQSLKNIGVSVIGLDQSSTLNYLGKYAFDKLSTLRQSGFFSDLEERYEIVVYIADTSVNSSWTSTCIQQGDCILLLADALSDPAVGEYERLLLKTRTMAHTELVLLHPEKFVAPGLTAKWLKSRIWVHSHHHIQLTHKNLAVGTHNDHMTFADNIRSTVETFTSKYMNMNHKKFYTSSLPHKNDFMRLARLLSGQAVGLVLGGGGARGFSHLGVLRALQENGIPIDIIGGTSIGAFIGGLYAKDYDLVPIYGRAKKFAGRIGSSWRLLSDLTIPITSYTTGHEFNRGIWKSFGDSRIEDFWIPYFCNSTNITNSCMEIHTSGFAWRFIRASMSLAGLLPPMTHDGSMLLDGGYVDNLPVEEMKKRGVSIVFAVDVGSVDDRTPMKYGDSLSGLWNLVNRWNPFSSYPNVPAMSEIQLRLCYVASVNALEKAKSTPGVIYLRPPIENYATLDFGKFDEIYNVGSVYGHMVLKELIDSNKMPKIAGTGELEKSLAPVIQRRNSI